MNNNVLKVQVRYSMPEYWPTAFWYDEYKTLCCFTFQEGHNEACNAYRLECKQSSDVSAKEFIYRMQKYYDSIPGDKITLKLVKKLKRP